MDDIIISMLQLAQTLSQSDVLVINVPDQSSETGFATRKTTTDALFLYFLTQVLFSSQLQTSVKTITGAINEIKDDADDAVSTAGAAATTVADVAIAVEELESYQDGDIVDLTDVIVNGFIEDNVYKIFIPLSKPATNLTPTISGTWNVRGATTHSNVTLASLGTITVSVEEQGIVITITSLEQEEGIIQFESIDAQITFEEEES